jgi:WD40 repeat protein
MGALTQRANLEYEQLKAKDAAYPVIIRQVMLRMVALGGGEVARRRVPLSELRYSGHKDTLVQEVLRCYTDARLLVQGTDSAEIPYVEPAHDALIRGWQKLADWRQEEEESLPLQRRLTPAAEEWSNKREKRYLWNADPRLDQVKEANRSKDNWLNRLEAEFVECSVNAKRNNVIIRWSIAGMVIVGSAIFGIAVWQLNLANSLARVSRNHLTAGRDIDALLAAIRAGKVLQKHHSKDPVVTAALHEVVYGARERNRLETHHHWVNSVAISPDGNTLASGSSDESIRLWDLKTGKEIRTLKPGYLIWSVRFSPDGKTLASGGDGGIILWDVKAAKKQILHQGIGAKAIEFSPNGKIVASAGDTIILWDVITGREYSSLEIKPKGNTNLFESISFSPDGKVLASGGTYRPLQFWDVMTGGELHLLKPNEGESKDNDQVSVVKFCPGGKLLASGNTDGKIDVWDTSTWKRINTFDQGEFLKSFSFTLDCNTLIAGDRSFDQNIKLWDVGSEREPREPRVSLRGHNGEVSSVSLSPVDDNIIVSGSDDNTIKIWNLKKEECATLSPSTPDKDDWRHRLGRDPENDLNFSPYGDVLASINEDNSITLWSMDTREEIRTLNQNTELPKAEGRMMHDDIHDERGSSLQNVCFSVDGKILGARTDNGNIKRWKWSTGELIGADSNPNNDWGCLTDNKKITSPDGRLTASFDGNTQYITLTPNNDSKKVRALKGHKYRVFNVSFSPDSSTLASASQDKTVKLWNLSSGEEFLSIEPGIQKSVRFSPNGKTLALASGGGAITLLNFDIDSLMERSCSLLRNYLENKAETDGDRHLCDGIRARDLPAW